MAEFMFHQLLPIIFNMSLTASGVILLVLAARLALKRAPKVFSYALWAVVLFRLLCPVSLSAGFSLLRLASAPTAQATAHTTAVEYVQPAAAAPAVTSDDSTGATTAWESGTNLEESVPESAFDRPVAYLTVLWLAGVGALALYSAGSFLHLRRDLVGAVEVEKGVYLADYIATPFVLGLLRPKIYLPSSLAERERGYILLHERCHIRRGDHVFKALAYLALCLHWFNPLVWLAFTLSSRDMEMSCDEAVLKQLGESVRADYSQSLLSLATGRKILVGTPLAFGEGDTKSRIKNLLRWRRPRVWIGLVAGAACLAVIAACAVNPQSGEAQDDLDKSGAYADMEDYAQQTMDKTSTVHYYSIDGGEGTANVTATKLTQLEKQDQVEDLAPEGTLEAWTYAYLVQVDVPTEDILMVGGMYEENGWLDLEGQGGHNVVALRYPDGTYDVLYDQVVNDNGDFLGCRNSYAEAVYDWYVTEYDLDLPLYLVNWVDQIDMPEDTYLGDYPAHRYDGDGWYLYIPVDLWSAPVLNAMGPYNIYSQYSVKSGLSIEKSDSSEDQVLDEYCAEGYAATEVGYCKTEGTVTDCVLTYPATEGGCYVLRITWDKEAVAESPYTAIEPQALRLMAESFTVTGG